MRLYAITESGIRYLAAAKKTPTSIRNKSMYIETLTADILQELTFGAKTKSDLISAINPKRYSHWFHRKDIGTRWTWLVRTKYLEVI